MKLSFFFLTFMAGSFFISCKDDKPAENFDTSGTYLQNDQMARPAINTVFVGAPRKNEFNTTIPTSMNGAFKTDFENVLTGRALADDVIDTELLLIFGGPAGTLNPGLTKDNVNANDKVFLTSFPYLAAPF